MLFLEALNSCDLARNIWEHHNFRITRETGGQIFKGIKVTKDAGT